MRTAQVNSVTVRRGLFPCIPGKICLLKSNGLLSEAGKVVVPWQKSHPCAPCAIRQKAWKTSSAPYDVASSRRPGNSIWRAARTTVCTWKSDSYPQAAGPVERLDPSRGNPQAGFRPGPCSFMNRSFPSAEKPLRNKLLLCRMRLSIFRKTPSSHENTLDAAKRDRFQRCRPRAATSAPYTACRGPPKRETRERIERLSMDTRATPAPWMGSRTGFGWSTTGWSRRTVRGFGPAHLHGGWASPLRDGAAFPHRRREQGAARRGIHPDRPGGPPQRGLGRAAGIHRLVHGLNT